MDEEIKIIQINVGNSHTALVLALQKAEETKADIILMQEIPKYKGIMPATPNWKQIVDTAPNSTAAILVRHYINPKTVCNRANINHIRLGEVNIINIYASPNDIIGPTLQVIDNAIEMQGKYIVAGDLNCRWPEFTKQIFRERNNELLEFVSEHNLTIANNGTVTLIQQGRETVNNYTFSRNCKIENWRVDEWTPTYSTHRFIEFNIGTSAKIEKKRGKILAN